jgi:hypothetical protein
MSGRGSVPPQVERYCTLDGVREALEGTESRCFRLRHLVSVLSTKTVRARETRATNAGRSGYPDRFLGVGSSYTRLKESSHGQLRTRS